ncbi:MAG: TolC family protein [Prevotellaceae bacterium]|jgi:outer membrane protein TolC|nr:TolC family protein [Prevotellaceae bacterium]
MKIFESSFSKRVAAILSYSYSIIFCPHKGSKFTNSSKFHRKFQLLVLISYLLTPKILSQTIELSLSRTIKIASDSSLQAFSAQNQYQANYWAYRSYKASRLPSLNLQMTPMQYYRDIVRRYDSQSNLDVFREQQSLYSSGNLSITQNVDFTGGTFYIDSELGYLRNFGETVYSRFNSVPFRVGYKQSLFGFNSFKWEKQIEPLKYDKAMKKFLYDREAISEVSTQHFFDLAMTQAEYDMARDNVASSDTLYRIGEERQKIASISQADLLTLKLDVVNARNSLKNAEISLKRTMSAFVSFLNMDKRTTVRLELPDRPKDINISVDAALAYARENNPDYLDNRQNVLEAEREFERAQKNAKFNATLSASFGLNNTADIFIDSYRQPLQQNVVSVGLSIPLVDWGVRKGLINMTRNTLNITKISVQQRELSLEQDVVMTVNDFNMQQDMIRSAEEALQLANLAYNTTKERFIIGRADINSLTLSLNRQKEAQKNYLYSLRNYWLSYYKIRKLTLFDFENNQTLRLNL